MVWKLNSAYTLGSLSNITDVSPVFDGKNMWIAQTTGQIACIEFWGPYNDIDNSIAQRWAAQETEYFENLGPKVRKIKSVDSTLGTAIVDIKYFEDFIYVKSTSKIVRFNTVAGIVETVINFAETSTSDMAIANDRIYYVNICPTTQNLIDQQTLFWTTISTKTETRGEFVPGKKQISKRHIVISNDALYISGMNTRQVHKFNAVTGLYLTSILVNRDIERLFRVENDVMVISSMRGKVSIDGKEFATSMVSQITVADSVNHLYGIINVGKFMADADEYVWFVNDLGGIQRTRKSDNSTFASVKIGTEIDPYTVGEVLPTDAAMMADGVHAILGGDYGISSSTNIRYFGTAAPPAGFAEYSPNNLLTEIKNIFVSPHLTYEYFLNGTFINVNIPRHLFLIKDTSIITVRLPKAFVWETFHKINQYTAVSTGGLGYKQG